MQNYDAIQQAALSLPLGQRAELGFLLLDTLDGLSEEEIERGEDLPPAQRQEALKNAVHKLAKTDATFAQAVFSLPVKERDKLATKLIHSLDEGIPGKVVSGEEWEEAWRIEIERRVRDLDSGKAHTIPLEEVDKKARAILGLE